MSVPLFWNGDGIRSAFISSDDSGTRRRCSGSQRSSKRRHRGRSGVRRSAPRPAEREARRRGQPSSPRASSSTGSCMRTMPRYPPPRDAVVHRVAEQLLRGAAASATYGGRDRQVVVLLGTQPAEAVAEVRTAPRYVGDVGAARVDRAARVHDRRTGRHLRVRDLFGLRTRSQDLFERRQPAVGPAVTSRNDARRAVSRVKSTNAITDASCSSGCGRGTSLHTSFVAVQPLLVGTGATLQEVAEVQLVARARRQQHAVADREQQRVAHDVGRERPRRSRARPRPASSCARGTPA